MQREPSDNSGSSPNKNGIVLTQQFLVMKTRQPLNSITKLNLWGNDLSDISVIKDIPNLEVLALTVNNIDSLKEFQYCPKLKELFLRRNQIPASLIELSYLRNLKSLKVLNLSENPIAEQLPQYRLMVIKSIPTLEKLDDVMVSYEEHEQARSLDIQQAFAD